MDLFESTISNEFNIYRYKNNTDKANFKLKYPLNSNDTIKDLFKNIYKKLFFLSFK